MKKANILFIALLSMTFYANADAPDRMHYQGTLYDAQGSAINQAGAALSFSIFAVAESGSAIWGPRTFTGVSLVDGRFNVALGGQDENSPSRNLAQQLNGGTAYIEITVGEGVSAQLILPRQKLESVPYAMNSINAVNGVPVGSIMAYWGDVAPNGWLLCDGRALLDSSLSDPIYNELKTHVTAQGLSSIPDMRGRVAIGKETMRSTANRVTSANIILGTVGGSDAHALSISEMPSHNHGGVTGSVSNKVSFPNSGTPAGSFSGNVAFSNEPHSHSIPSQGGNSPHNNMQPYIGISYIIKY
jgi:microcystin-dependent protein